MRNKVYKVTTANLNTHAVQVVPAYMDVANVGVNGVTDTIRMYPKKVQLINKTGVDVKVNLFSSEAEYQLYVADPTNYDLFTVANNTTQIWTSGTILPPSYKIVVQAPNGSASADFEIEAVCYQPK